MKRKAFTLIELLVVIAIIAILAAILFPVFSRARLQAHRTRSLSNINQIGLGVQQYMLDHDGAFPGWMDDKGDGKTFVHNCWDEQIDPYVRAKDVYTNGDTGIKSPSQTGASWNRVLTYGINGALLAPYQNGNVNWQAGPQALSTSSIANPSGTILFAELATEGPAAGAMTAFATVRPGVNAPTRTATGAQSAPYRDAYTQWIDIDPKAWVENTNSGAKDYDAVTWNAKYGVARDLYSGGGCYAFVDGHVAFQRLSQTTTGNMTGIRPEANWTTGTTTIQYNQWYPG